MTKDGPVITACGLLVVEDTFLLLNEDEMANMFTAIRAERRFSHIDGADDYLEYLIEKFRGQFIINEYFSDEFEVTYTNQGMIEVRELKLMEYAAIKKLLINELFLNDQMRRVKLQIEQTKDEIDVLHRERCASQLVKVNSWT